MKISVILGSTREVRRGERVSLWLMNELKKYPDADFELLDLQNYHLPFYAESSSPDSLENGYSTDVANKWAAKIAESDGFILIAAEYNHGPTAVLKNALDYVYNEWNKKPVGFVSYSSGNAAGIRAVEQLRLICTELQMAPMQGAVHIRNVVDSIDEDGNLQKGHYAEALKSVVEQLLWWASSLKIARENN
jgi:NAD(P)H-dependent FMN reductase